MNPISIFGDVLRFPHTVPPALFPQEYVKNNPDHLDHPAEGVGSLKPLTDRRSTVFRFPGDNSLETSESISVLLSYITQTPVVLDRLACRLNSPVA